jgi:hypothetical protein
MNLAELIDDTLQRLGESQESPIAAFQQGDGTIASNSQDIIKKYLNEGYYDLARNYHPIRDDGFYEWPAQELYVPYASITPATSGNIIRAVRSCQWGATNSQASAGALTSADRAATENWYRLTYPNDTGTPKTFFDDGTQENMLLYPVYTAGTSYIWVKTVVIPVPLENLTDAPQFAPDIHKLLSFYACDMIITKRQEDQALASRGNKFRVLYQMAANELLDAAWRNDEDLANDLLKGRPTPPQSDVSPQQEQ